MTEEQLQQVRNLVEAVWQCLDDMGKEGTCVCPAAKAELRVAFAPFDNGECSPDFTLEEAEELLFNLRY